MKRDLKTQYLLCWSIFAIGLIGIGCAPMQPLKLPGQEITLNYDKPKIELSDPKMQTQGSEKLRISIIPNNLKEPELNWRTDWKKLPWNTSECCMAFLSLAQLCKVRTTYKKTMTPYYEIPKQDLVFSIFAENHLGHILCLDRSVATLEINGKLVYWNQVRYLLLSSLFSDIILPEEKSPAITISTPIDSLPSPSNIVLSIYDIVTDMDAAGNPTERLSYKWEYQYNVEKIAKQEKIEVEQIQMTTHEAFSVGAWKP